MEWAPETVVALVVVSVAIFTDLRARRIPNLLTYGTMALALAMYTARGEPVAAIIGIAAAFALSFPAFLLGGAMRAGDAKLLMALGALLGGLSAAWLVIVTYAIAIPFTFFALVVTGRLRSFFSVIRAGIQQSGAPEHAPLNLPFAPVIAAALVVSLCFPYTAFWGSV